MPSLPDIAHIVSPGNVPKVKSKVLARLLPSIELALDAGYTHEQIHTWIEKHGLKLDRKYYHDAIYRLRKRATRNQDTSTRIHQAASQACVTPQMTNYGSSFKKEHGLSSSAKTPAFSEGIGARTAALEVTISQKGEMAKFKPINSRNFDITNI